MLGSKKVSKILTLYRRKAKNAITKISKTLSLCKIVAKETFDFSKSHPLGTLVLLVAASIYVFGGSGNKMLDIAVAIGLFPNAIAASKFDEEINKKSPRDGSERYEPISIRLHPQVIKWAKKEAEAQGVEYQTIINEALLKIAN